VIVRVQDPLKLKAYVAFKAAIRKGEVRRQPCQRCGSTVRVHGHHEDYTRPLDVIWLCHPCHGLEHRKTHCARGHELTPDNLIIKGKNRTCRECSRITENARHAIKGRKRVARHLVIEEVAAALERWYPDNASTNAFCAAIRSLKSMKLPEVRS
jgi:hypothetical protein